jgi:hypothetical protein
MEIKRVSWAQDKQDGTEVRIHGVSVVHFLGMTTSSVNRMGRNVPS